MSLLSFIWLSHITQCPPLVLMEEPAVGRAADSANIYVHAGVDIEEADVQPSFRKECYFKASSLKSLMKQKPKSSRRDIQSARLAQTPTAMKNLSQSSGLMVRIIAYRLVECS